MDEQFKNMPDKTTTASAGIPQKKNITLPVIAIILDFSPVLFSFLASLSTMFLSLFLISILAPVIGIITGIIALCQGRKRIGIIGTVLAVIAISAPFIFVFAIIMAFRTGALVISM